MKRNDGILIFIFLLCAKDKKRILLMKKELPDDVSLWDEECMKTFIETHSALFHVFISRYISDSNSIDDFLQEAYIQLWTHRTRIGKVKSIRNYFYSIIQHIIADKHSISSLRYVPIENTEVQNIETDSPLFNNIVEAESAALIAEAINKLSRQGHQVLLMSLEGKTMPEIATSLNISVNTVKTIKYRAIKRLSELLSKEDFLWFIFILCI